MRDMVQNTTPHWSAALTKLGACREAVEWAETQPTAKQAWRRCKRGDWLLWIAAQGVKRGSAEHRSIVLAACGCARLALPHVPTGEDRPRIAIETAETWARSQGGVTLATVRRAAAAYATSAATSAAAYADAAYADAERTRTLATCATIVRRHVKRPELG